MQESCDGKYTFSEVEELQEVHAVEFEQVRHYAEQTRHA